MMTRIALLLAALLCLAVPAYNGYFQNKVSAESFVATGAAGITTVIRLGTCELDGLRRGYVGPVRNAGVVDGTGATCLREMLSTLLRWRLLLP